jgi:hypothetical protein
MVKLSTILSGLSAGFAFASPVRENREYRLEDIQCRCLTFRPNERPTSCNFLESKGFGWRSAYTLASQYDIQVQFASKSCISRVLSISTPLPNDLLHIVTLGDAQSASSETTVDVSQNKIVCGFDEEVRQLSHYQEYEATSHFAGQVIAWLMLLIIVYAAGEYIWTT